jgi:hypothetical protein
MSEKNRIMYDEKGNIKRLVMDPEEFEKLKAGDVKEIKFKMENGDEILLSYEK